MCELALPVLPSEFMSISALHMCFLCTYLLQFKASRVVHTLHNIGNAAVSYLLMGLTVRHRMVWAADNIMLEAR